MQKAFGWALASFALRSRVTKQPHKIVMLIPLLFFALGAPDRHKEAVLKAGALDTLPTVVFTGRPMRVLKSEYVKVRVSAGFVGVVFNFVKQNWEEKRPEEIRKLCAKGIVPVKGDLENVSNRVGRMVGE